MMFVRLVLIAATLALATPAGAQSMNVPYIASSVTGQVCAVFAERGDMMRAIAAAQALGYRPIDEWADRPLAVSNPPDLISLRGSHQGTLTLSKSYSRGICAVGVAEGGPSNMGPAVEPLLLEMGMKRVVDIRDTHPLDIVVWRGQGRLLVISSSPHFTPGSELVFSFDTGGRAP